MKDAGGHGSAGRGLAKAIAQRNNMFGGGNFRILRDQTSNAEAGQALMSSLKSTQAPVNDAMQSGGYAHVAAAYNASKSSLYGPGVRERVLASGANRPSHMMGGQTAVRVMRGGGKSWGNGLKIRGVT